MILFLTILNSLAFIIYGIFILLTDHMISEFQRYKLVKFRKLTGVLELLGGAGCCIGYFSIAYLSIFSCLGLALLMSAGTFVRFKVKDPIIQILPAISLGLINYFLAYKAFISL